MADELPKIDLFKRIINVNWGRGGPFIVLFVQAQTGVGPAIDIADPAAIDVRLHSDVAWFGWNHKSIQDADLAEKNPAEPGWSEGESHDQDVPLFNVAPNKREAFAVRVNDEEETSTATFHVLDRGLYGIIDRQTGATISSGTGPFGTTEIPFIIDYNGDCSGGGGLDVRCPDNPNSTYYANLALAKAIAVGAGGTDWDVNLLSEISGHDTTSSATQQFQTVNRLVFINYGKLKADNPGLAEFVLEIEFNWPDAIAKKNYAGFVMAGVWDNGSYASWPLNETEGSDFPAEPQIGYPLFFPPADPGPGVPIRNPSTSNGSGGAIVEFSTSETKKGPAKVRLTFRREDPSDSLSEGANHVTAEGPIYAF